MNLYLLSLCTCEKKIALFFWQIKLKTVVCTNAPYKHIQFKHTFCTTHSEANCCLPGTALNGQVQPILTAVAWNPLQRGGQGCTIPVEEQHVLHAHVHTRAIINKYKLGKKTTRKINLKGADLGLVPQRCLFVHLCCWKHVLLPVTVSFIEQVTHPNQGWRYNRVKKVWLVNVNTQSLQIFKSQKIVLYHMCQDFDFGLSGCNISTYSLMQKQNPENLTMDIKSKDMNI